MKNIHIEIQKASDWGSFSRADLLFCVKQFIERLGELFDNQVTQVTVPVPTISNQNRLLKSYKEGVLPSGAKEIDSLPLLKDEIEKMIRQAHNGSVNLPNSSLQYRTVKFENGEVYQGQLSKDGRRHGLGTCIYPDGTLYQGFWNNDLKHGIAKYVTNGYQYEGIFQDNLKADLGLYKFATSLPAKQEVDNEILLQKADFSITPDKWDMIGNDYLVMQRQNSNEVIITQ